MKPRLVVLVVLFAGVAGVLVFAPYRARSGPLERALDEVLVGLQDLHPAAYNTEYPPPAAAEAPVHDTPDTGLVEQ